LITSSAVKLIFTDLDGTLLDRDTYSWEEARPALGRLKLHKIPWIIVTSKTRAEVEFWRKCLGNQHPFIVENGAAAFIPTGYFPFAVPGATHKASYEVLEWGTPYAELVTKLKEAVRRSRCRIRAFHQMTAAQAAAACDLPVEQAALAKLREYDEPFQVLDLKRAGQLLADIEKQGLRWTRGGRFWHITGANDKAVAVAALTRLFEQACGRVETIGLGDAANDAPFLNIMNVPVLVRSADSKKLQAEVPRGTLTGRRGPAGWNEALLKLIACSS
jgi:mannosyl-3-phosphoglycerate phosphatase